MRPATLAEAYELMIAGEPREAILSEFLDSFYLAPTPAQRPPCFRPAPSGRAPLCKPVAAHYGLTPLETGLISGALAKSMLERSQRLDNLELAFTAPAPLDPTTPDPAAPKRPPIGEAASIASAIPQV